MITLITRKYICLDCNNTGKLVGVIKNPIIQIPSEFVAENIENLELLHEKSAYSYKTERDEFGLLGKKIAYRCTCESCHSKNIEIIPEQEFKNVMNFFPPGEPEKWYNHMN